MIAIDELTDEHVRQFLAQGLIAKELSDRLAVIPPGRHLKVNNGSALAMGGITTVWPGVGVAWLKVFPDAIKYPIRLCRIVFDELCRAQEDFKLHRIHIEVRADDPRAVRFAHLLSFVVESTMSKYGPDGADYHMMTWQP